jgi:hypothetical protein
MRRLLFLGALFAVVAAAFVLGAAPFHTGAQPGTPTAGERGFVGAWHLTTETPFGASRSLITLMADGTVIFSDRPVLAGDAGFPDTFIGTGHGAWEQTGPDTAAATFVFFITDGEGTYLGDVTDSVEITLAADGASWSGPFSSMTTDPGGQLLFIGEGTVEATRIMVQPLATPLATPAA